MHDRRGDDDDGAGRAIFAFSGRPASPFPIRMAIAVSRHAAGTTTAIMRTWAPADAAACRLCERCECSVDEGNACLVIVPAPVAPRDAGRFSLIDYRAARGIPAPRVERDSGALG